MTAASTERSRLHQGRETRLRVLHLIILLGEPNGQYNEHCLPLRHVRDISICTYFEPRVTPPPELTVFAGDGTLRGFFRALAAALERERYDVIHAHAPETGGLLAFALAPRARRWRFRRSLVYTVQDSFYDYDLRDKALMLLAFPAFRRVVFCGHAAYESYPRLWRRLAGKRARIVQNAADFDRLDRALQGFTRTERSGFSILSIGRLEEVKDPFTVLGAFEQLPDDCRLTFVGAGSLEGRLASAVSRASVGDRVELTGLVPRDSVFERCADADVFVSASHGEGLPVAVIEAMAAGCPVVLSDIPPHREVADGAEFVPLVAPGDAAGFTREIERLRELAPGERAAIGDACRKLVRERFSLEKMHADLERVYRELR